MANYKNILAAIDFSPSADEVAKQAVSLANLYQSTLTLLHVVEYLLPMDLGYESMVTPDWTVEENEFVTRAKETLESMSKMLKYQQIRLLTVSGIPKNDILRIAVEQKIDLIVLGSHGRHGLSRLLGSTANSVMHNAPCDVLAIRLKN